jgi:hypothetical protein
MEPVDLADVAEDFDRQVAATVGIDGFCSSSAWILPAAAALMPPRTPYAFRSDHGYFAAMRGIHPAGFAYVEPLELAWGLASPVIGADAVAVGEEVVALLASKRDWQVAILPGMADDGPQRRTIEARAPARWERRLGTPTVRHVASLEGGVDGYVARRSRDLRKSLRKGLRAAAADGITFASVRVGDAAAATALYARIQAVEARSWKSAEAVGIGAGPMREFYAAMLPRLAPVGRQRTIFARHGEVDVGYILGAVFGGEYRGLQFSYDDDYARFGLGGLLQYHQIVELCAEGVERYDLGTDMDYKRRWAERQVSTGMLILLR